MIRSCTAENIRRIMDKRGLKQTAVARTAGYSAVQFNAMLTGRKVIKDTDVLAIALALAVTPNELFGI